MQLHPDGIRNLINAIYKHAAKDYKKALECGNDEETKRIEEFLLGGYYGVKPAIGENIIFQVRKEVRHRNF